MRLQPENLMMVGVDLKHGGMILGISAAIEEFEVVNEVRPDVLVLTEKTLGIWEELPETEKMLNGRSFSQMIGQTTGLELCKIVYVEGTPMNVAFVGKRPE